MVGIDDGALVLVACLPFVVLGDFVEVKSGAEGAVGAVENAHPLSWVMFKGEESFGQLPAGWAINGIAPMQSIDCDGGDAVRGFANLDCLGLSISHFQPDKGRQ